MSKLKIAIDALDASQRAAFDVDTHCAVLAPPGSGKTRLLVAKLANSLVNEVTAPQGAACITLTNNAATEVQQRFADISSDNRPNLFIGTVHAFAFKRIIRPYADVLEQGHLVSARVGRATELEAIWEEALDLAGVPHGDRAYLKPTVDRYRNQLATEAEWGALGTYTKSARDAFLYLMDQKGVLDFGRMIEIAVSFVESESAVREGLSATFPRLFVDEYQDLAPGLDRIVCALAFGKKVHPSTLFAVGDVEQAIYRWTGTDPGLLLHLAELPGVTKRQLSTNYRSGADLVEITRRLLSGGTAPETTRGGGRISTHKFSSGIAGQVKFIADVAEGLAASGTNLQEIAVFCGTNAIAKECAGLLESRGLPSFFRAADDWETPLSIIVERICAWAAHGQDASGHRLSQMSIELSRSVPGVSATSVRLLSALAIQTPVTGRAVDFVAAVAAQLKDGATLEAVLVIEEELEGLLEATGTGVLSDATVEAVGARRVTFNKIYLTTFTSSKGLEFDHTFIVGLEDGQVPYYSSTFDSDKMDEERRKFYVAVTRAREQVYLLWSGFNTNKWGKRFNNPVSRFVTELGSLG